MSAAILRARTAALHDAVDEAFGGHDLATRDGYRAFLRAHARALPTVEAALLAWNMPMGPPRAALLMADLAALGETMPLPLPFAIAAPAEAWGVLYVVEGSRLGGAVLARQVQDLPHAYLAAAFGPGEWKALRASIDREAESGGASWIEAAVEGATACFAHYGQAALKP